MREFTGIDISKKTFDIYFEQNGQGTHVCFNQNEQDYKRFINLIGNERICIMEATGNYHVKLSRFLYENKLKVLVENPLKIKRFSQMRLQRNKTDKADSKMIYEYGKMVFIEKVIVGWKPDSNEIAELKQYDTVRQQFTKQLTALTNTQEAMGQLSDLQEQVDGALKLMIKHLKDALNQLDMQMQQIVETHHKDSYKLLTSIPGVGPKTATMMICLTDGFRKFDAKRVKPFISYIGMSPRTYESGTSVKGAGHITKVGNGRLRTLLYLCSWTAKRVNPQCAELHKRLFEKGKPEKVIKIAIAHKLVRQMFGVIKSGSSFSTVRA